MNAELKNVRAQSVKKSAKKEPPQIPLETSLLPPRFLLACKNQKWLLPLSRNVKKAP